MKHGKAVLVSLLRGLDEYDTLRPVADLIRELSEQMRTFLDKPQKWEPFDNGSEEMRQAAVDTIAREMYSQLHTLTQKRLIRDHVLNWETAFSRYGRGSARVRAHDVEMIYHIAAPTVDEVEGSEEQEFLVSAIELVRDAVRAGGGKLR